MAAAVRKSIADRGLEEAVDFRFTGCHGFCEQGPVAVAGDPPVFYAGLAAADADDLVASTVAGKLVERLLYIDPGPASGDGRERGAVLPRQTRCSAGHQAIEPTSLDDALAAGAYEGLARALTDLTPEQVIEESAPRVARAWWSRFPDRAEMAVLPTGGRRQKSWSAIRRGDPGAFMDAASWRAILTR